MDFTITTHTINLGNATVPRYSIYKMGSPAEPFCSKLIKQIGERLLTETSPETLRFFDRQQVFTEFNQELQVGLALLPDTWFLVSQKLYKQLKKQQKLGLSRIQTQTLELELDFIGYAQGFYGGYCQCDRYYLIGLTDSDILVDSKQLLMEVNHDTPFRGVYNLLYSQN